LRAALWCGSKRRLRRPWSRMTLLPPITNGMMPAWQAIRRAWSAVIRSPVEVTATPASPSPWTRVCRSMTTDTVVAAPPC
jgi:hypothetical protein